MRLRPSSRKEYREYQDVLSTYSEPCMASEVELTPFISELKNTLILPEGGSNLAAIDSLRRAYQTVFAKEECHNISHAVCATGTGATIAGLSLAAPQGVEIIGVQAVAEGQATLDRIKTWGVNGLTNLTIEPGHLGGFGKIPKELINFITDFEARHNIPLDPIYNGKAMFRLLQLIAEQRLSPANKILFIHTGGLQGKRNKKTLNNV